MSLSELGRSRGLEASARVLAADVRPATHRRGGGVRRSRPAPSCSSCGACGCSTVCRSRSTSTGCRCGSRRSSTELDFTHASLYDVLERAGHPAARADYELEARGAEAPEAELLGLAPARRSCSRRQSRSARTAGSWTSVARVPRRPLPVPGDADAPRSTEGESGNEESMLFAACWRSCWRSPSPRAAGRPGAEKPRRRRASRPRRQDQRLRRASARSRSTVISSEGSGGPHDALKELTKPFKAKYPNVTVKLTFRDFASWIKQAKLVASATTRRTSSRATRATSSTASW